MRRISNWIRKNWTDTVWSKVFAGVILAILGGLGTIIVALYKKIPLDTLYQKAVTTYFKINYLTIIITILILLSILIPAIYFKIIRFQLKHLRFPNHLNTPKFNLESFLSGQWLLKYTHSNPGLNGSEPVAFKNGNQYYINNELIFVLTDFEFDEPKRQLKWTKLRFATNQKHSRETLQIINERTIRGTDDMGYTIDYSKTSN